MMSRISILLIVIITLASCKQTNAVKTTDQTRTSDRLIDLVDVTNPEFKVAKEKDDFDAVISYIGMRSFAGQEDNIKFKLYLWEDKVRGYYQTEFNKYDIQVYGYRRGDEMALKSHSEVVEESGYELVGKVTGPRIEFSISKGKVGGEGSIIIAETEAPYNLIFDDTDANIFYQGVGQ